MDNRRRRILVLWDFENMKPREVYNAAISFRRAFERALPLSLCQITAYGNTEYLTRKQKKRLYRAGVRLFDIGDEAESAADRQIMIDLLEFAFDNEPHSFVFLISGDKDFCRLFATLKTLGFTTVLISRESGERPQELVNESNFNYWWERIISADVFVGPNGVGNEGSMILNRIPDDYYPPVYHNDCRSAISIYWDRTTIPYPRGCTEFNGKVMLLEYLESRQLYKYNVLLHKAYGSISERRNDIANSGVTYEITTASEQNLLSNCMLCDMLQFAVRHRNSTMVIVSNNIMLSGVIHRLKERVIVLLEEAQHTSKPVSYLADASSEWVLLEDAWPRWRKQTAKRPKIITRPAKKQLAF